jgi:hypothetical protein
VGAQFCFSQSPIYIYSDNLEHFARPSTATELPCDVDREMHGLTVDQKGVIKHLYKIGRKSIKLKSHVKYLSRCLETKIIPKSFKIKKDIPGNQLKNQQKLDQISLEAVYDEKERQSNVLKSVLIEFEKLKRKLRTLFDPEAEENELKRLGKHLNKIEKEEEKKKNQKCNRDVTLAHDDGEAAEAHNGHLPSNQSSLEGQDSEIALEEEELTDVTLAPDDDQNHAHKIVKKRRRFKRRFLQPQPQL